MLFCTMRKAIFSAAIACSVSACFSFSKPIIQFDRFEYDLGKVLENTEQQCEFVFRNRGTATLVIKRVSAG
ncbi:MAG: DUF1573 domain-containing protein [Spirochaetes bacterium]|nr:DUF1573 domain-containing protein [Spirochaetota bacterium]